MRGSGCRAILAEAILAAALVVSVSGCSNSRAAPTGGHQSTTTAAEATSRSAVAPTTEAGPAVRDPGLRTMTASAFRADGDAESLCGRAVTAADPNHYDWRGLVLRDTVAGATRWLFCYGEAASGQGVVALVSQDSALWLFTPLGFGPVSHAGDSPDATVYDTDRAAVTYDSLVRGEHDHAFTADGGRTWLVLSSHPD